MKEIIIKNYTCLIFGEGGGEINFLRSLIPLLEKHHAKKWFFNYDHASGSSPETILKQCQNTVYDKDYDLILCFIDIDKLKEISSQKSKSWEKEKIKLEEKFSKITIIWQINNLEDEFKKVIGNQYKSKHILNQIAKKEIAKFINSDFWKRILKPIKKKERELDKNKEK